MIEREVQGEKDAKLFWRYLPGPEGLNSGLLTYKNSDRTMHLQILVQFVIHTSNSHYSKT